MVLQVKHNSINFAMQSTTNLSIKPAMKKEHCQQSKQ